MFPSRSTKRIASTIIFALVAPMTAFSAAPSALQTKSDIEGISLIALAELPHSPENDSLNEYCQGYRAQKLTAVGNQVAKHGWIVTSEASLGRYEVVTFASGFTPGTSGICFARNSNIAIYDGGSLVALAYNMRSARSPLGTVEPLEDAALLVWTDPPGSPVGELHDENNELRFTTVAPERAFCGGRAIVPNVYGRRISLARKILITHGWQPKRPRERPNDEWIAAQLGTRGIIEAESCSGTGAGYCSFNYRGAAGALHVTTAGDYNKVDRYGVDCAAR
jgi:hypothetical protein